MKKSGNEKVIIILTVLILSSFIFGCSGEPKYSAEEWEKIKAIRKKESDKETGQVESLDIKNEVQDRIQDYYKDLDEYNNYMQGYVLIHDKYYKELVSLFDNFDKEQEDLNRKNNYAQLIIEEEEKWITELIEMETPVFLQDYHAFFIEFLNNNKLFYFYFLEPDLDKADEFIQKADEAYSLSLSELDKVKNNFNERAYTLELEAPFLDKN